MIIALHNTAIIQLSKFLYLKNGPYIIIDIGAHIGNTVLEMYEHKKYNFLCLEPSKYYFELLTKPNDILLVDLWNVIKARH